jgi:hypothetical protein
MRDKASITLVFVRKVDVPEWDGPAVLPPRQRACWWVNPAKEHHAMPRKTNATTPVTIGIDPGKNTFHLIGLDARGGIVLREKVSRDRIVARLANVLRRA